MTTSMPQQTGKQEIQLDTILQVPNLVADAIFVENSEHITISNSSVGPARDLHSAELYAVLYYPAYAENMKLLDEEPMEYLEQGRHVYIECEHDGVHYVGIMVVAAALSQVSQRMIEFKNTYLVEKTSDDAIHQLAIWFSALESPLFITHDGLAYNCAGIAEQAEGFSFRDSLAKLITSDIDVGGYDDVQEEASFAPADDTHQAAPPPAAEQAAPAASSPPRRSYDKQPTNGPAQRNYNMEDAGIAEGFIEKYIYQKNLTKALQEKRNVGGKLTRQMFYICLMAFVAALAASFAYIIDVELYKYLAMGGALACVILATANIARVNNLSREKRFIAGQIREYETKLAHFATLEADAQQRAPEAAAHSTAA